MGGLIYLFERLDINLCYLPGDIRIDSGNVTCVLAIGTSLLISILLTVDLNIVARSLR
ncbi:DUF2905 domain-containing protein [Chloroflexota bacterium]